MADDWQIALHSLEGQANREQGIGRTEIFFVSSIRMAKKVDTEFYKKVRPISGPISPDKQGAKRHWGSHPYFTRRAWNVVQQYIKNFSQPGDLVLDPYGGSGVTAIESLVLRRRAIHCDINPMANFICTQIARSPVDLSRLQSAFAQIQKNSMNKIHEVYRLKDSDARKLRIHFWYPNDIRLPKNSDVEYVHELFTRRQLYSLSLLLDQIRKISADDIRELMLFVFSATLNKTNLTFSSTHGRLASRGNSGIMHRYRYWVPPKPLDLNVWEQFEQKFKNIVRVKAETNRYIADFYSSTNLKVLEHSATDLLKVVKRESVDYIYTDPPYGAHIAYLDLSTMWNAWLGFHVDDELRSDEVIEGGDLNKSKEEYISLLEKSIKEMFEALKFGRWMSIVFAHKDPAYWDAIIKSSQKAGFEYVNTAVQPSTTPSLHKRQNPLRVLSGELVLNFRKVRSPKTIAIAQIGVDVVQLIKEVAELTIVVNGGATTEQIYNALIPKLLENGLLNAVKQKLEDITPLLKQEFLFSEYEGKWQIRPNTKIGSFIPLRERIRFYLMDFLQKMEREGKKATFDDIIQNVMPNLINGTTPKNQTILSVLEKVATSADGITWTLSSQNQSQLALGLEDEDVKVGPLPRIKFPKNTDQIAHNCIIFALAMLGKSIGLEVFIGKKERDAEEWQGVKFSTLSPEKLPIHADLTAWQKEKIQQIDVIWFTLQGEPVYAFEIELSTPITTGIDRFMEFLKVFPGMAKRVVLVIPSKRRSKIDQLLSQSHYVGHPLYMENKLTYCFALKLVEIYSSLFIAKTQISLSTVKTMLENALITPKKE